MQHGLDAIHGRQLSSLDLGHPADLAHVSEWPAPHFAVLIAWDATQAPVDVISDVAERLLRAGASYFVCWGPDCERVHDIIDEIASVPEAEAAFGIPSDSCIMTTWHTSQTLEEALQFLLLWTKPAQPYDTSTHGAVAVSIGSPEWAATIRSALGASKPFIDAMNGAE